MADNPNNYMALNVGDDDPASDYSSGGRSQKDNIARKTQALERARKMRADDDFDENWETFIDLYSSEYQYPELDESDDVVAPNMVFSTVNVIVPSVAVNHPKITVSARKPEDEPNAAVAEAAVNYQWRQYGVQEEVHLAVKDFVIIGHGWIKTVWDYQTKPRPWTEEEWRGEVEKRLAEREMAIQAGVEESDLPTEEEVIASIPDRTVEVVSDRPAVTRVSPFDVLVDPSATRLADARWLAHRTTYPIEVARKKPEWSSRARSELKKMASLEGRSDQSTGSDGDVDDRHSEDRAFAVVWEWYDLVNNTVCTFAEGGSTYLAKPKKIPFTFGHPFLMVRNYDVPDRFFPIGDVETIYSLQIELATSRTQMVNDRKAGRRIYLTHSDVIKDDGIEDLMSGQDQVILDVDRDVPLSEAFIAVNSLGLPPEWYAQTEQIVNDIDLISGVSEYQRGSMPEIRRTATEASLIQDAANARSADKLAKVEKLMASIGERMIRLSQQFMTVDAVAKIVGEDGAVGWQEYSAETLVGEFDFDVEAGSTQPQNETFRRQSAMQLMDAMAPFMQMGVVDPYKLAEHVLRNGFGIKNPTDMLVQQQPQMDPSMMGAGGAGPAGPLPPGVAGMPPA